MSVVLTSDDVNLLIYRYLLEAGYTHTAFSFGRESCAVLQERTHAVPQGALVSFLQKGLQLSSIEHHVVEDGTEVDCDAPMTLVAPHVCTGKRIVTVHTQHQGTPRSTSAAGSKREREREKEREKEEKEKEREKERERDRERSAPSQQVASPAFGQSQFQILPMANNNSQEKDKNAGVIFLAGHSVEVFVCAWHPKNDILATGAGDSTARIWRIPRGTPSPPESVVLPHPVTAPLQDGRTTQDVTTLAWSPDGKWLATGSYDGQARVWDERGNLKQTLIRHQGPIFSLKWNRRGDRLLSGSVDQTAIVWDAGTAEVVQQFANHCAPTLDVDWRDDSSFATCSTDRMVYVYELGREQPLRTYTGHVDEVNAIRWNPQGTLLASASDDATAKLWSLRQDTPVHDLKEHQKEIYNVRWRPDGAVLATASFDSTVKLWDAATGSCTHTLTGHKDAVYSVEFSPDGQYIASGSYDANIHVWSATTGQLLRVLSGPSSVFEVSWNCTGDKLAACFQDSNVCVFDLRA
eukprot:TRINITY_DN1704_c0_g2_i1.p1 TRINITY_DN1704_c0_g2~~TRINITY_DN1704_c0_g2_i1.p1  ORF type:complete len:521 (-),score=122.02 TRINITY_DN1704_c0_g2_i1:135-1697(-)